MYPTRAQVRQQFLALLDDPAGTVYDPSNLPAGQLSPFQAALNEAYDVLYNAFLNQQVPRIVLIQEGIVIPPMTTSVTPAEMGIDNFGSFEWLGERLYGSTDKFLDLTQLDRLDQRAPVDRLLQFVWRNNTFYFIGATTVRELQLEYDTSGVAPTTDVTIMVDGCQTFLSNYAAGVAGGRKGEDELAARCFALAVGPKFNMGTVGGELYRLILPLVRERQHVQVAHKPYTTQRRLGVRRGTPYVAAQAGTTGGGSQNTPVQFSSANGTIVGTMDGTNLVFYLTLGMLSFSLYRNGVLQTLNVDYTALNNQITFLVASVPQSGDLLTAEGYPIYQV